MGKNLYSITSLLLSFGVLCLGHGLQSVLLPAHGATFSHPNLVSGAMMSAYYAGFILGTFVCPRLIFRVGHIRTFAAASGCASAIMLLHALLPQAVVWILLRFIYGFCFIHLYTVMESWLNSIGDNKSRGRILSVYMIINFLAMSGGQMLFFTASSDGFQLYSLAAIMLSLAVIPLMVGYSIQPAEVPAPEPLDLRRLFADSPLGVMGALVFGLIGGAYWGLSAVFVLEMGYEQNAVAWFMAASLIGGLLMQWPLGSLSDRINRRWIIVLAAVLIGVSSALLFFISLWRVPADIFSIGILALLGAGFGAGFHPLYSLCLAHASDFVGPKDFVRTSAGLQSMQGIGAVLGPLFAGLLMYLAGYMMLFVYIGGLAGILILYAMKRITENRPTTTKWAFSSLLALTRRGVKLQQI